jgi:hypothetical protein
MRKQAVAITRGIQADKGEKISSIQCKNHLNRIRQGGRNLRVSEKAMLRLQ